MHSIFSNIQFGPFKSNYHALAITEDFKDGLNDYLEKHLLTQVEEPFEAVSGSLLAAYDEERYCGPNSIVRDIYKFEFSFHRSSGDDTIKEELVFNPQTKRFSTRRNAPLYLWTNKRRTKYQQQSTCIQMLCEKIAKRAVVEAVCPLCAAKLAVHDEPSLFDVRCPNRCFNYNYHRDPKDGAFLHGHFFQNKPNDS